MRKAHDDCIGNEHGGKREKIQGPSQAAYLYIVEMNQLRRLRAKRMTPKVVEKLN